MTKPSVVIEVAPSREEALRISSNFKRAAKKYWKSEIKVHISHFFKKEWIVWVAGSYRRLVKKVKADDKR